MEELDISKKKLNEYSSFLINKSKSDKEKELKKKGIMNYNNYDVENDNRKNNTNGLIIK